MIELNNSEEIQKVFPQVGEKKLSQLLVLCSCMLATQSTNLKKCAQRMSKILGVSLKNETAYSRLLRYFQTGNGMNILRRTCLLVIRTLCRSENCYLLLDRTDWQFGKRKINILVIGLLYKDVFIPLVWKDLEKKGNSNTKERLDLIDQLLEWWQLSEVKLPQLYLAGDREFIGYLWLRGLEKRGIKFVIRIRANSKIELWYRGKIKDRKLGLKIIQRYLSWTKKDNVEAVLASDYIVNITIFDNDSTRCKADYIFIMTNMEDIQQASILYRKRYKIEVCFKHLKSSGFNLESLQVEGGHKIDLMFSALNVLYLMAIQNGLVHFENKDQPMKPFNHSRAKKVTYQTLAKSIFNQGCDMLYDKIFSLEEFYLEFNKTIQWIARKLKPSLSVNYT
jgi:hypothetical protein